MRMVHLNNDAVQKHGDNYGKFESANKMSLDEPHGFGLGFRFFSDLGVSQNGPSRDPNRTDLYGPLSILEVGRRNIQREGVNIALPSVVLLPW